MIDFKPNCLPLLIGSLPMDNHEEAARLILQYTPEIPLWPQLPVYPEEGMIPQFLTGLPGRDDCDGKTFINPDIDNFDADFLAFYEEYIMVTEGGASLENSRFALTPETARGFFEFLKQTAEKKESLTALKAQTTGPITFCTGVVDQAGKAIYYNEQLRDAAIKLLALKARWQIQQMAKICDRNIMFFDEPGLAGFGSSAFITITPDDITSSFREVFAAVQAENALAGVHVCANTEWSLLFEAGVDIVSFDAYSYFDKFILYPDHLLPFIEKGGILASGIIPTTPEFIDKENIDSLTAKWLDQTEQLTKIGIPKDRIFEQTLITPSCGTGSVSMDHALKVLELTKGVSKNLQNLI